jgi:hypothetical protein
MGSAYYETTGKLKGTPEEQAEMIKVFLSYTEGVKDAYFTEPEFETVSDNETSFSAQGPYGKFDGLNDMDAFRKMAEAAPTAYMEVFVDGQDSYMQEDMRCCLQNGVLKIETSRTETEDEDRAYLDYVLDKMPYKMFISMYGIEPDSLAEDDYEDFVNDLIIDSCEDESSPFDMDYDMLVERLETFGGETTLDEETYEVVRRQAAELGISPEYDFSEGNDCTIRSSYLYDAMTGQYLS